jgi:hypothetical protein
MNEVVPPVQTSRCVRLVGIALAVLLIVPPQGYSIEQYAQPLNTHAKNLAFYLRLLPEFAQWPKDTFADEKAPFVIGILGEDPFADDADILDKAIRVQPDQSPIEAILKHLYPTSGDRISIKVGEKKVIQRRLAVKRFAKLQPEIAECHLLFISAAMEKRMPQILKLLESASVLTVGDVPEFIDHEGAINCVAKKSTDGKEKILIGINLRAARRNNLKLDQDFYSGAARRIES